MQRQPFSKDCANKYEVKLLCGFFSKNLYQKGETSEAAISTSSFSKAVFQEAAVGSLFQSTRMCC